MVNEFSEIKEAVKKEKKITKELISLAEAFEKAGNKKEKEMIGSQIKSLRQSLKLQSNKIDSIMKKINLHKKLEPNVEKKEDSSFKKSTKSEKKEIKDNTSDLSLMQQGNLNKKQKQELDELERMTLKRLKKKKKDKIKITLDKKPSTYVNISNKLFSEFSRRFTEKQYFKTLERALIKSNLRFTANSYFAIVFFTTLISIFSAIFITGFLLFFNLSSSPPFISAVTESAFIRFSKIAWLLLAIPIGTFVSVYFYPFLERKSIEHQIEQELPFATIHMAAISGSMIDPTKIFQILIDTKEYPALEKEFTKILNEINVYGLNLVSALRNVAFNSPSGKLSEILNGLATTITSGGDLPNYFEKRADNLLFEHRLQREKSAKSAETFMDIYVSVVIAAPMILMLLVMMIQISGIGISLNPSAITLIFILAVSMVNIFFIVFLHIKQSSE